MADIGIIVNHEELHRLFEEGIRSKAGDFEIALAGPYSESVAVAETMFRNGALVIIARGGHAVAIRTANIPVQVIAVPFTASNLAQQLFEAKTRHGRFAVIGNSFLLEMAKELEVAMSLDIEYRLVTAYETFLSHAEEVKAAGITAMVGGYDASRFASDVGLETFLIRATSVEIAAALYKAGNVLERVKREKHLDNLLRTMVDSIHEGVVLVDADGIVTQVNRPAKRMLEKEVPVIFGSPLQQDYLRSRTAAVLKNGVPVHDELLEANDYRYSVSILPIGTDKQVSGAIVIMQEVEYVRRMEHKIRYKLAERGLVARYTFDAILGASHEMRSTVLKAKQYSLVDSTILINGENGTGKEFFAQSIHNHSLRRNEAFVAVNCATIPPDLLASELFGYDDGAFTGAKKGGKTGLFELAHNGTIFLDEIGEVGTDMQARLLRVLEERQIMRVGGDRVIPVNIRVITATNKDITAMVREGTFREDVYYRINVLALSLPPLRDRKDDLPVLMNHFIDDFCDKYNRNRIEISAEAMETFMAYDWPGNVRELKNVIERLVVTNRRLLVDRIEAVSAIGVTASASVSTSHRSSTTLIEQREFELIKRVLHETGGNKTEAAQRLGISRPTLNRRLKDMVAHSQNP